MDIDNPGINFSRIALIGVVATFPTLRRVVLGMGLLGVISGGLLWQDASTPLVAPVVNPNPVCNRVVYQAQSKNLPPELWGRYTKSEGSVAPSYYVHEAGGSGWCRVKHDDIIVTVPAKMPDGREVGMYAHRWYEVPSKYGDRVDALAPKEDNRGAIALMVGFVGVALLLIWLPAAIVAAVGRRWMKNVEHIRE